LLYCALIGFIYYEAPAEEKNMNTLVEMTNAVEVQEDNETFENAVGILFNKLDNGDPEKGTPPPQPNHFALREYKKYKLAAGDVSCRGRSKQRLKQPAVKPFAA